MAAGVHPDVVRRAVQLGFALQQLGLHVAMKTCETGSCYLEAWSQKHRIGAVVRVSDHNRKRPLMPFTRRLRRVPFFHFDLADGWTPEGVRSSLEACI